MEYQSCDVSVTIGDKEFVRQYQQVVRKSVTVDDLLKLLSNSETAQKCIDNWHYGMDLRQKSTISNAIRSAEAGPEKSFEKNVKEFMKLREISGKPVTEEQAKKIVKAMQEMEAE